jgi:hypothetical protein
VYTAAPQYLGYLLDRTRYGRDPHYGRTLVSSAMFPVPRLGAPFRHSSGLAIYNDAVYGPIGRGDLVTPFQGELFLDFTFGGVAAGYLILGLLISRVQRSFERAPEAFAAYVWQYAGIWLGFLVIGSLAVVSQIAIYFFWPALVYALLRQRAVPAEAR